MKRICKYKSVLTVIILTITLAIPLITPAQPKLGENDLYQLGRQYYNELPATVGLEHASLFSETVRYFYAYEQRMYRNKYHPGDDFLEAMNWLSLGLDAFNIGKGDVAGYPRYRPENLLQSKGLEMYDQVRRSDENGKIWNVQAYISASANLCAFLQVASSPSDEARNAFKWLLQNKERLIDGGVSGDFITTGLESWIPPTPKPGLDSQQATSSGGVIQARRNNSKCLHKKYNNWSNGNPIHLWDCNAGSAQMKSWIYEMKTGYIRSTLNPDKCLHKKYNNWDNGNPVHLWDCNAGSTAMKTWNIEPLSGMLQSRENPTKCLHKKHNNWNNSNPVHLWDCKAGSGQMKTWSLNSMVVQIDN